jgi:membrane associated rhomboid family serine protease
MHTRTSPFALTLWTRRIIVANAIVYLLQITLFASSELRELAFVPALIVQQPWTAITYMFLHGGMLHLTFNMMVLFFFGSAVEEKMGSRYPVYYLLCGAGGAALSFAFVPTAPIIGASAAVYGIALAFAYFWPDNEIMIFPLPVPIKVKWLVGFLAASSLFLGILGSSDGVAHFAHLGGFLTGAIYLYIVFSARRPVKRHVQKPQPEILVHPTARAAKRTEEKPSRWRDKKHYQDVDRVLDKISESGIESLNEKELAILNESSKNMGHN